MLIVGIFKHSRLTANLGVFGSFSIVMLEGLETQIEMRLVIFTITLSLLTGKNLDTLNLWKIIIISLLNAIKLSNYAFFSYLHNFEIWWMLFIKIVQYFFT